MGKAEPPDWDGIPKDRVTYQRARRWSLSPWARAIRNAVGLGFLVLMAFAIWYPRHVRQAEYDRIVQEGVAATGLVDRAYTRHVRDHGRRRILVVRYYTDGTPGPPRRSGRSMFQGFPSMPGSMMGEMPPSPEYYGPPPSFDMEAGKENGRIYMHSVGAGEKQVSAQFYKDHPVGSSVEVRYLPRDTTKFVLLGTRPGGQSTVMWMMIGVILLMALWRFWRMYVR